MDFNLWFKNPPSAVNVYDHDYNTTSELLVNSNSNNTLSGGLYYVNHTFTTPISKSTTNYVTIKLNNTGSDQCTFIGGVVYIQLCSIGCW
mgnify:CR=1 FL=1